MDNVQYSKGSYTNRVQLLLNNKAHWITVPCKPKLGMDINEVRIVSDDWQEQQLEAEARQKEEEEEEERARKEAEQSSGDEEEVENLLVGGEDGSGLL